MNKKFWTWWTILTFLFTTGWGLALIGHPNDYYIDCNSDGYSNTDPKWKLGYLDGFDNARTRAYNHSKQLRKLYI